MTKFFCWIFTVLLLYVNTDEIKAYGKNAKMAGGLVLEKNGMYLLVNKNCKQIGSQNKMILAYNLAFEKLLNRKSWIAEKNKVRFEVLHVFREEFQEKFGVAIDFLPRIIFVKNPGDRISDNIEWEYYQGGISTIQFEAFLWRVTYKWPLYYENIEAQKLVPKNLVRAVLMIPSQNFEGKDRLIQTYQKIFEQKKFVLSIMVNTDYKLLRNIRLKIKQDNFFRQIFSLKVFIDENNKQIQQKKSKRKKRYTSSGELIEQDAKEAEKEYGQIFDYDKFNEDYLMKMDEWLAGAEELEKFISNYDRDKEKKVVLVMIKPENKLLKFQVNTSIICQVFDGNEKIPVLEKKMLELYGQFQYPSEQTNFNEYTRNFFEETGHSGLVLFSSASLYKEQEFQQKYKEEANSFLTNYIFNVTLPDHFAHEAKSTIANNQTFLHQDPLNDMSLKLAQIFGFGGETDWPKLVFFNIDRFTKRFHYEEFHFENMNSHTFYQLIKSGVSFVQGKPANQLRNDISIYKILKSRNLVIRDYKERLFILCSKLCIECSRIKAWFNSSKGTDFRVSASMVFADIDELDSGFELPEKIPSFYRLKWVEDREYSLIKQTESFHNQTFDNFINFVYKIL